MLTLIEGLAEDLDLKKIVAAMKKTFQTNGAVLHTDNHGNIIQLNGDVRIKAKDFLVMYHVWDRPDADIIVHGV